MASLPLIIKKRLKDQYIQDWLSAGNNHLNVSFIEPTNIHSN